MTLDEFATILRTKGAAAEVHHATDSSLDEFRSASHAGI
ncbi:hypothetical protein AcdelDRAFT_1893 [Acidovorax delafieldii 2AN]|uniref:Uncharacterized protein n=1 Tax=Acidovorax delafieldii 2AN TaxID=573060 RepID=C5T4R3_ACIDE|nr:hypothetical protein AcdelDRAFT_1893 [Acidovorax delafieldii 2AN]